jgi:hypothetical protein
MFLPIVQIGSTQHPIQWVLWGFTRTWSLPLTHIKRWMPPLCRSQQSLTAFIRPNTGIVGSNPTRGTDICVLMRRSSSPGVIPIPGVLLIVYNLTPWPLVRKRTIPTERPPLVDEIYCQLLRIEGCRVVSAADPLRSLIYWLCIGLRKWKNRQDATKGL